MGTSDNKNMFFFYFAFFFISFSIVSDQMREEEWLRIKQEKEICAFVEFHLNLSNRDNMRRDSVGVKTKKQKQEFTLLSNWHLFALNILLINDAFFLTNYWSFFMFLLIKYNANVTQGLTYIYEKQLLNYVKKKSYLFKHFFH